MTRIPHIVALPLAAALALVLSGCTQVAAIAPVGGDHLAEVRFAAIDVLTAADVELLSAPDCTEKSDGAISCTGEALDGSAITVESTADDPESLTVAVGSDVLYTGSILEALETALRPAS